jgi:hypothetical protein
MEVNVKCQSLRKITWKWTLRQIFICLRPPLLLDFSLGWSRNCVGSESSQIESIKLLPNIVSNKTQPNTPTYCTLTWGMGGGGELNQREG